MSDPSLLSTTPQGAMPPARSADTQFAMPEASSPDLPITANATITRIREVNAYAEVTSSTCNWIIGTLVGRLRELGVEHPAHAVSPQVGLSEERLRDAERVSRAFDHRTLCRLARRGVPWKTLRALADPRVAPSDRAMLVGLFDAGRFDLHDLHRDALGAAGAHGGNGSASR